MFIYLLSRLIDDCYYLPTYLHITQGARSSLSIGITPPPPPRREEKEAVQMIMMPPALLEKYSEMLVNAFEKKVDELILNKSRTSALPTMMTPKEADAEEG